MLGGIQTKGYKACPICLDDIDAVHNNGRMSYQGARRWLPLDHHDWMRPASFNGKQEFRTAPPTMSARQVYAATIKHSYPLQSTRPHNDFKQAPKKRLCWTHVSIFWELPYWTTSSVRYALDVMHIEKNVCDNVFGTVLGLDGKTKDDAKSRATLEKMGIRSKLWAKKGPSGKVTLSQADYTVQSRDQRAVFDYIAAVKYPRGYAGSLKNKVKVSDKKFRSKHS